MMSIGHSVTPWEPLEEVRQNRACRFPIRYHIRTFIVNIFSVMNNNDKRLFTSGLVNFLGCLDYIFRVKF